MVTEDIHHVDQSLQQRVSFVLTLALSNFLQISMCPGEQDAFGILHVKLGSNLPQEHILWTSLCLASHSSDDTSGYGFGNSSVLCRELQYDMTRHRYSYDHGHDYDHDLYHILRVSMIDLCILHYFQRVQCIVQYTAISLHESNVLKGPSQRIRSVWAPFVMRIHHSH